MIDDVLRLFFLMDPHDLRNALDALNLSDAEAARLLYISPNVLARYLLGQQKIPGPLVAAVEAWQRCGPPPGAQLITEKAKPGTIALMRELRDALAAPPQEAAAAPKPKRRSKKAE